MSEYEYDYGGPGEIWDPLLGRNVYLGDFGGSAAAYITQNWDRYRNYDGAVTHVGGTPIHSEAFTGAPTIPKNPKKPSAVKPVVDPGAYRMTHEQTVLNPFDADARARMDALTGLVANNVRVAPGVRPDLGFLPGVGPVDLMTMMPTDWGMNGGRRSRRPDDLEMRFLNMATERDIPFPTLKSVSWDRGQNPHEGFSGRGFEYGGQQSPEEAALEQAFRAGDQEVDLNRLAALRGERVERVAPSGLQQFGNKFYGPLVAGLALAPVGPGVGAAFGPLAGAAAGSAAGAFTAGAATRWDDPAMIALGAAGGAAGGYGGSQLGGMLASPMAAHAVGGAGTGVGGALGRGAARGEFNSGDILRSGVTGAAGGAVGGGSGLPSTVFGPAINYGADTVWPRDEQSTNVLQTPRPRRARNPFA